MESVHEMGDLAPRDIVTRAIDAELKQSGDDCVYLDISFKSRDFILDRFPNLYNSCLSAALEDEDWQVREAAALALRAMDRR
jgi:L-aspartate oxidase